MGTVRLGLEVPSTHHVYSDYIGHNSSEPISASVLLLSHTKAEAFGLVRLQVSLVLVISISNRDGIKANKPISSQICRLLSLNSHDPSHTTQHCSIVEDLNLCVPTVLADCRVGYSPEKGNIYKIPFFMPIPAGIPVTTATELGHASASLVASTTTADGHTIGTSEEIKVERQIIPGSDPIQHTRTYPTSKVVKSVTLKQILGLGTNSHLSLAAKIFLKRPAIPTNRAMEFKCVAIRGLQWRVEEVTQVFNKTKDFQQSQVGSLSGYEPDHSFTRELFRGYQKGYWGTLDNPILKEKETQQAKDSGVEIAFEIAIPRAMTPAPAINLACYGFESRPADSLPPRLQGNLSSTTQETIMITVEHRLKLDIVTSEDTFHVHNKSLVERKPLKAPLDASFPLYIAKKAREDIGVVGWQATPPCYSEIPVSPPKYEPIL
jgi:hypothetical protein